MLNSLKLKTNLLEMFYFILGLLLIAFSNHAQANKIGSLSANHDRSSIVATFCKPAHKFYTDLRCSKYGINACHEIYLYKFNNHVLNLKNIDQSNKLSQNKSEITAIVFNTFGKLQTAFQLNCNSLYDSNCEQKIRTNILPLINSDRRSLDKFDNEAWKKSMVEKDHVVKSFDNTKNTAKNNVVAKNEKSKLEQQQLLSSKLSKLEEESIEMNKAFGSLSSISLDKAPTKEQASSDKVNQKSNQSKQKANVNQKLNQTKHQANVNQKSNQIKHQADDDLVNFAD